MPLSLVLELSSASAAWTERSGARLALAYALLAKGDPSVAARLHDLPGGTDRPFTLALLPEAEGWRTIRARVTALNDEAAQALGAAAGALVGGGGTVEFGEDAVTVAAVRRDDSPLAEAISWQTLATLSFRPRVALAFVTPTAFKLADGRHLPLPDPDLMLKNWARRWNVFCPAPLAIADEAVAALLPTVALAHATVATTTQELHLRAPGLRPAAGKMVGFTGEIVLQALRPQTWTPGQRATFAALVAFSRFCGTGSRTPQGFGLTLPG